MGYHGRLRATVDVDMLVPRSKLGSLARALRSRGYVVAHTQGMVRVYPAATDPEHPDSIADLVAWPTSAGEFQLIPGFADDVSAARVARREILDRDAGPLATGDERWAIDCRKNRALERLRAARRRAPHGDS